MLDALARYERAESETMLAAGTPYKAQSIHDRCDTIRALCEDLDTGRGSVRALRLRIEELFKDSEGGMRGPRMLTLSTVHKAKGREWPRVFLLHPKALMPSKRARPGWELEQEHNLMYVAYTRAQSELVFVE
jgi:superfamily I DNA/RNA helicase